MRFYLFGFFSLRALAATADFDQKLLGSTYPIPINVGTADAIKSAAISVSNELQNALNTGLSKFGNISAKANSLSATVVSAQDQAPLLDFHYTAANLNVSGGSTKRVTGDSVFRIGSISKLFTVYTLLLNGGEKIWDRPVTDYLPELRKALLQPGANSTLDYVQWDQVTIGALASQLAGIGRDGRSFLLSCLCCPSTDMISVSVNNADLASQPFPYQAAGLPKLPPAEIPICAGNDSQPPCTRKGLSVPNFPKIYNDSIYSDTINGRVL